MHEKFTGHTVNLSQKNLQQQLQDNVSLEDVKPVCAKTTSGEKYNIAFQIRKIVEQDDVMTQLKLIRENKATGILVSLNQDLHSSEDFVKGKDSSNIERIEYLREFDFFDSAKNTIVIHNSKGLKNQNLEIPIDNLKTIRMKFYIVELEEVEIVGQCDKKFVNFRREDWPLDGSFEFELGKYMGDLNDENQPHGSGAHILHDDRRSRGSFNCSNSQQEHESLHERYIGNFKDGQRDGEGLLIKRNHDRVWISYENGQETIQHEEKRRVVDKCSHCKLVFGCTLSVPK